MCFWVECVCAGVGIVSLFMHVYYFILARCVLSHSIFHGFLGVFCLVFLAWLVVGVGLHYTFLLPFVLLLVMSLHVTFIISFLSLFALSLNSPVLQLVVCRGFPSSIILL